MAVIIGSPRDRTREGVLRTLRGERTTLTMGGALGLLRELDLPESEKVAAVLECMEQQHELTVRAAAIRTLGLVGGERALDALRSVLSSETDGRSIGEAALAIGWIGGPEDVERVREAAARTRSPFAEERAVVGSWLLAHRHVLQMDLPAYPRSDVPDLEVQAPQVQVTSSRLDDRRRQQAERLLRVAGPVGPRPVEPLAVAAFRCGEREHIVVTGRDTTPEVIRRQPTLAAIVVARVEETDELTPKYVVLTRPGGDRDLAALVTSTTGEPVLRGGGRIDGATVTIELRAVSAPGAIATEVTVLAEGDSIDVTGQSEASARQKRTPAPAPHWQ